MLQPLHAFICIIFFFTCRAFISFAVDEVTSFSPTLICNYLYNEAQRDLCIQYPSVLSVLNDIPSLFYSECNEQFKYDRWNCSQTVPPISSKTSKDLKRRKHKKRESEGENSIMEIKE